jgi:hypothetical protein
MAMWVDRIMGWYNGLPGWAALLLYPVVAPALLAYSTVVFVVFLVFVLPYLLIIGSKRRAESPQ